VLSSSVMRSLGCTTSSVLSADRTDFSSRCPSPLEALPLGMPPTRTCLLQLVLHRLHTLIRTPGGLDHLRLAVELHVAGDLRFPYTLYYTLPDLLLMRNMLRAAGCRCHLVSLLRMPLMQELSWHAHFVNAKAPLCFWYPASDCGTRMALGLTCHDAPRVSPLKAEHAAAAAGMWKLFDLVGVTEFFDEFVLLLSDMVGLPNPAYRAQLVDAISATISRHRQRRWSSQTCKALVDTPPGELLTFVEKKLNTSRDRANRIGRTMECSTYGCLVGGKPVASSNHVKYERAPCDAATAEEILRRICGRVGIDERIYLGARSRFRQLVSDRFSGRRLDHSLRALRLASEDLATRAQQQKVHRLRGFQAAKSSCVGCSGDVVPEFDLGGCWPLWHQFAPDEQRFKCTRTWTQDPAYRDPSFRNRYVEKPPVLTSPMACWTTCWTPTGSNAEDKAHCTAACPPEAPRPNEWRRGWNAELSVFKNSTAAGLEFVRLAEPFVSMARGNWHQHYLSVQIFRVF
jgi:hypothetical protein